ncbi:MAG: ATP-binding protein, partial [Thermodesulfobacteriota bacterium]|nr:ATP-binding protein [Thermodesulfobacteriota bacterium]
GGIGVGRDLREIYSLIYELKKARKRIEKYNKMLKKEINRKDTELKRTEEKYQYLVENANDIIFVTDRKGRFTFINKKMEEVTKYINNGKEILSMTLKDITSPDYYDDVSKRVEHMLETGNFKPFELEIISKESKNIYLELNLSPIFDDGSFNGTYGIGRDLTERKKLEEEKRNLQAKIFETSKMASIGKLSAGLAHEINNPLGIILGYTQVLVKELGPDWKFNEDLKIIEKHVKYSKKILEDLLSFARQSKINVSFVDLNQILEELILIVKPQPSFKNIEINANLSKDIHKVRGDPERLKQVFLNIVINAASAVKDNGELSFATQNSSDNKGVEIVFKDNGIGISKENTKKIFDPFFTTKEPGTGTGLGLSVSYGIIKEHKGDIFVESIVGKGTTFTIFLPYNAI